MGRKTQSHTPLNTRPNRVNRVFGRTHTLDLYWACRVILGAFAVTASSTTDVFNNYAQAVYGGNTGAAPNIDILLCLDGNTTTPIVDFPSPLINTVHSGQGVLIWTVTGLSAGAHSLGFYVKFSFTGAYSVTIYKATSYALCQRYSKEGLPCQGHSRLARRLRS